MILQLEDILVSVTSRRLASMLYWKGMWRDVRRHIRSCAVCQQNKYETIVILETLQPLPIP